MTEHRVPARASLAGNPSDGYGGAVLAVPVPELAATARISTDRLADELELVVAARARFSSDVAAVDDVRVEVSTTIPRSVGLAGSSAIVTATIRALAIHAGVAVSDGDVAALCHRVEREDLGIAGGWQDQIAQAYENGRPILMEFDEPRRHRHIDAPPVPLFLAYSADASESSNVVHSDLRNRANEIEAVMQELADVARSAADALAAGRTHDLKAAINASFDLRESVLTINPAHRAMITAARAAGAACNFAGSGGAIVGIVPKDPATFTTAITAANLTLLTWMA